MKLKIGQEWIYEGQLVEIVAIGPHWVGIFKVTSKGGVNSKLMPIKDFLLTATKHQNPWDRTDWALAYDVWVLRTGLRSAK